WEYLYDRAQDRFLCLSERTPLVRYLPLAEPIEPLTVDGPLRILTVIANPTVDGVDLLDVEQEWANLTEAVAEPVADGRIARRDHDRAAPAPGPARLSRAALRGARPVPGVGRGGRAVVRQPGRGRPGDLRDRPGGDPARPPQPAPGGAQLVRGRPGGGGRPV